MLRCRCYVATLHTCCSLLVPVDRLCPLRSSGAGFSASTPSPAGQGFARFEERCPVREIARAAVGLVLLKAAGAPTGRTRRFGPLGTLFTLWGYWKRVDLEVQLPDREFRVGGRRALQSRPPSANLFGVG